MTENIFAKKTHADFSWERLGNIAAGRPNLGLTVPVKVYRVFEYAMYDILCHRLGEKEAQEVVRLAGHKAGKEFAANMLDLETDMDSFLADVTNKLKIMQIGILRVEQLDKATGKFVVTVAEDLDCSGLPVTGEVVCNYDEGFLAGVFEAYTKAYYCVREVDCWASGEKVCRFEGSRVE